MDARIKDILIGAVAGYALKAVWGSLGLPTAFTIPVVNMSVGGSYFVGFLLVGYGLWKSRKYLWIGLGVLAGVYVRDATAPEA